MTRQGELEVTLETLPRGDVIVRVAGELDMATTPSFVDELARADPGGRLVVDLTACTFLDSSAVRALTGRAQAAGEAGGSVSLVASDDGILRTLEIAGTETLLPVHPTLEAAL